MTLATTTVRDLPIPADKETKVGNYFVSNYPPFSFWTEDQVESAQTAFDQPPAEGNPLGLYVHIPFCRKRCHFCYFKVYTDKNASAIKRYLDCVIAEAKTQAVRACIGGRDLKFVYFGGGTPSYLSADQLKYLTDGLKHALPWDAVEEVAFECEPGTLNEKKVHAIRELGVTRLSFGIENFSDHILEINGRAHLSKQVFAAYAWAKEAGFPQINIDLIAGMLEETDENWLNNIRQTIDLDPDCVTIYQMEIPFNTGIYKTMKESGKLVAPVADWNTKRRWVKHAFDELEAAGYAISSAYTAVKNPEQTKFVYRDMLWHGADMLALGVASFGHMNRVHYQNQKHIEAYCDTIESDQSPIHRAMPITDEEEFIREFILQIKLGHLNTAYFKTKFGIDPIDRYAGTLNHYRDAGFLTLDGDDITLDRDALLQVDGMLHEFSYPNISAPDTPDRRGKKDDTAF